MAKRENHVWHNLRKGFQEQRVNVINRPVLVWSGCEPSFIALQIHGVKFARKWSGAGAKVFINNTLTAIQMNARTEPKYMPSINSNAFKGYNSIENSLH